MDADWLAKKKRLGPTEQDLRVLSEPNPVVRLRLFLGRGESAESVPLPPPPPTPPAGAGAAGGEAWTGGGDRGRDRAGRAAYNRSFGLHCAAHHHPHPHHPPPPLPLLPTYALELNFADIFGSAASDLLLLLPHPHPHPHPHRGGGGGDGDGGDGRPTLLAAVDQLVDGIGFAAMLDRIH